MDLLGQVSTREAAKRCPRSAFEYIIFSAALRGVESDPDARPLSLNKAVSWDQDQWHNEHMGGVMHMLICSVAVHPNYQSRGVGSLLVQAGTKIADAERLPCWVHSSHDLKSVKFYTKMGFREVGKTDYDMDEYNKSINGFNAEGEKLGVFSHSYMLRSAVE